MIDDKKIEEAAERQLDDLGSYGLNEDEIGKIGSMVLYREEDVKESFKAGINWFLGNLWHPASEEPKDNHDILIESLNGTYTEYAAYRHNSAQLWSDFVDRSHTTRWLYIDDLLKGRK